MDDDLAQICDVDSDRANCPDALIAEFRGGSGLFVRDGGGSIIGVAFCPWCGATLLPIGDLDLSAMKRDAER